MLANLKLSDWGTIIAIVLALGGLVFSNAKSMSDLQAKSDQHGTDIARIDRTIDGMDQRQREDHAAIVGMQKGIDFLVKEAEQRRK